MNLETKLKTNFKKKLYGKISYVYMVMFLLTLGVYSCSIPFMPEVPPSSYSTQAAINVLSNKYNLLDSGDINGFGDIYLGDGKYSIFDGVDGMLMVFRYDKPESAKENWEKVTKKYGNPFKMKYFKVNMGVYGLFTIRLDKTDLYIWYKDNWLIVITGDGISNFVQDVNEIYKTLKR
ncbi:MAG: DUF3242 domain-containing protein [Fervidobacterium sp.]|jgi:hypothetical protein